MYIIYVELEAHVISSKILGISTNLDGIIEIIWTYSRFMKKLDNFTYEENIEHIKISKITNENYEILNKLLNKYDYELYEKLEKLINSEEESSSNEWKDECCNVKFYHALYDTDCDLETVFSKKECKIINKIIDNSTLLNKL